jgi:putative copper export protein
MLLLYLYHYTAPPPVAGAAATSGGLAHLSVIYALSFMGSSAARFSSIAPALVLGVLLCGVVLFAIKLKYYRSNPPVFYAMLLIMVNALAVSGLRSDLGLAQSLASRYRIYSNLFLVFTYIFFIEAIRPTVQRRAVRNACFGIALTISIAFCCLSDFAGARFLQGKKQALTFSYRTQWQGRSPAQDSASTELLANPALHRQILDGIYDIERPALEEAIRADVYTPPQNP